MGLRKPWQVWLAFGIGLSLVVAAMGWVSAKVLELDEKSQQALRQAQFEERVRLALWRLDSVAAPIIATEAAQPYFSYRPFYPAEGAYSAMFEELRPSQVLLPSPLLDLDNDTVRLHFQRGPDGALTSPQVPLSKAHRSAAADIISPARLNELKARLEALGRSLDGPALERLSQALPDASAKPAPGPPIQLAGADSAEQILLDNTIANTLNNEGLVQRQQAVLNTKEYVQRSNSYGAAGAFQSNANVYNPRKQQVAKVPAQRPGDDARPPREALPAPQEGAMVPVWAGQQLLVARRVALGEQQYLQGAWLDWEAVERRLLRAIDDLLPQARLTRLTTADDDPSTTARRLAALPVRLEPGAIAAAGVSGLTPLQLSLIIAWGALLLGAFAVAGLMRGALVLSERRGAFVSAVTHELRTPLTTFRMYTEMLAGGMISDPDKQQRYVDTLHAEAERLGHLVENVLAYARLERRPDAAQVETLQAGPMLERFVDRLRQRAAQAELELTLRFDGAAAERLVLADAGAVERILFNLVDNACKYAAEQSERRELDVLVFDADSANLGVAVRDFGPGIEAGEAAAIFRAFHKSAKKAAQTAPGVGLGLALCKRLAVAMGGQLRLEAPTDGPGARFVLTLPLSR